MHSLKSSGSSISTTVLRKKKIYVWGCAAANSVNGSKSKKPLHFRGGAWENQSDDCTTPDYTTKTCTHAPAHTHTHARLHASADFGVWMKSQRQAELKSRGNSVSKGWIMVEGGWGSGGSGSRDTPATACDRRGRERGPSEPLKGTIRHRPAGLDWTSVPRRCHPVALPNSTLVIATGCFHRNSANWSVFFPNSTVSHVVFWLVILYIFNYEMKIFFWMFGKEKRKCYPAVPWNSLSLIKTIEREKTQNLLFRGADQKCWKYVYMAKLRQAGVMACFTFFYDQVYPNITYRWGGGKADFPCSCPGGTSPAGRLGALQTGWVNSNEIFLCRTILISKWQFKRKHFRSQWHLFEHFISNVEMFLS